MRYDDVSWLVRNGSILRGTWVLHDMDRGWRGSYRHEIRTCVVRYTTCTNSRSRLSIANILGRIKLKEDCFYSWIGDEIVLLVSSVQLDFDRFVWSLCIISSWHLWFEAESSLCRPYHAYSTRIACPSPQAIKRSSRSHAILILDVRLAECRAAKYERLYMSKKFAHFQLTMMMIRHRWRADVINK